MTSPSHRTLLSPQRFTDYLNGLRQEFDLHANALTRKPCRFDIYLGRLKDEFEHMAERIESLQAEMDEYKEKIKLQTKENVHRNFVCEHCRTAQVPDTPPPPKPVFQPETLRTASTPLRMVSPSQQAHQSSQHATVIRKPPQPPTSRSSEFTIAHSNPSLPSHFPQLPAFTLNPDTSTEERSIIFNNNVRKELDIEMVHVLPHPEQVWCVKFRKDGKYLAAGCRDGKAYIYHVQTGSLTRAFRNLLTDRDHIAAVCFSCDGKYLASSSLDRIISIWDIKKKFVRNPFKGHTRRISSLEFSPNSRLLLSTSYDNTVRLWSIRDGATKFLTENNPTVLDGPGYTSAVFSPDGRYVAASHRDGVVRIWDARTRQLLKRLRSHTDWVFDLAFMPDGKGLVSGGWDKTLKYWDISALYAAQTCTRSQVGYDLHRHVARVEQQSQPERQCLGHQHAVVSLAISPDGRWIVSGSGDHSVRVWDARNGEMQCIFNNAKAPVYSADFSPAGGYLASGGDDGTVRIWKCSSKQLA